MTRAAAPLMMCLAMAAGVPALALAQAQPMYGPSITADTAKKIAPAAIAEAKKNGWTMAIAIVDTHGELVYFERMDEVSREAWTSPSRRRAPPPASSAPPRRSRTVSPRAGPA